MIGGQMPGMGIGMDYRNLGGGQQPAPFDPNDQANFTIEGPNGTLIDKRTGQVTGYATTAPTFGVDDTGPGPTGPSGNPSGPYMPPPVDMEARTIAPPPAPVFGGGQQQPITAGTGQLPPGFGSLSPIDRSQIGRGQIGMTGAPANRFAPPNAPGVRTARQSQPPPAPARVPAARVSNTNVQTPARVAPRSAPKPITRTRSR
jgi:hypothetical protein